MRTPLITKTIAIHVLTGCLLSAAALAETPVEKRGALRVCADPFSLPTSSREEPGYENRIAQLFADKLGVPLEYEWFPQRIGFIRNTLRNDDTPDGLHKCDIVMGVIEGFELAATSIPYYRSAWSMVYVKGGKLDSVKTMDDMLELPEDVKKEIRIGLFDKSPAAQWVFANGFMENARPYQMMPGDARVYPGQIIENDLLDGDIDISFVWGPIAGFFSRRAAERGDTEVVVIPMPMDTGVKYDYQIAMAVRYGEKEWKEQVNDFIRDNREEIEAILDSYHVPRLPLQAAQKSDDDDD